MGYATAKNRRYVATAVDGLVCRVLRLSSSDLWRFFDRMVGLPEVVRAGWNIQERRLSPRPNAQRDAEWTRLHAGGLTYAEIAHAHNTNRHTVAKAVQRFRQRVDNDSLSTPEGGYHFNGGQDV